MKKFYCDICNSEHIFHGTITVVEPPFLIKMTQQERNKRVHIDEKFENFIIIDSSFVVSQAEIYIPLRKKDNIPFNKEDDAMLWKVWIKFDLSDFIKNVRNSKEQFPVTSGTIFNIVPPYKDSKDSKIEFTIDLSDIHELLLITKIEQETELGQDYYNGLNESKMVNWMKKTIYHPSTNK